MFFQAGRNYNVGMCQQQICLNSFQFHENVRHESVRQRLILCLCTRPHHETAASHKCKRMAPYTNLPLSLYLSFTLALLCCTLLSLHPPSLYFSVVSFWHFCVADTENNSNSKHGSVKNTFAAVKINHFLPSLSVLSV